MKKPELLAPVGSREALVAAVQNGADAVYLGGRQFNARRGADNFNDQEIVEAIEYAHARDVKVYVAVNILLADTELREAAMFLLKLYNAGADAVIVQDFGIIRLAKQLIPELELHASTQMTAHNVPGVMFLKNAGLQRVVLARELGLDAIKEIKRRTGMQLETFIHGALCVCYSGQCLMSSMIGGRSGNRGRCAQPCRLEYRLLDEKGQVVVDSGKVGEYLLSPRDLNLSAIIPRLIEAGIDSFKIEGRMRRPEYVATVVRVYRTLIDKAVAGNGYAVTKEEAGELKQIFNRGFTTGYYLGNPGKDLMSYKRPNNRGTVLGRVRKYDRVAKTAYVELEAPLRTGDGIEVWVTRGGRAGTVVSELFVHGRRVEETGPGEVVSFKVDGYIHPGDRVFKSMDAQLMEKALQSYTSSREIKRIPLNFSVWAGIGEPLLIEVRDPQGRSFTAQTGVKCEEAKKQPLTEDFLVKQLDRLGNTPFAMNKLDCNIKGNVMVPVREINDARRRVVEELMKARIKNNSPRVELSKQAFKGALGNALNGGYNKKLRYSLPRLAVAVNNAEAVKLAVRNGAELIYWGGDFYRRRGKPSPSEVLASRDYCKEVGAEFYIGTPRILNDSELPEYMAYFEKLMELQPDGVLIASYGLLNETKDMLPRIKVADFYLNIFNRQSAAFLKEHGVQRVTLSTELTGEQIKTLTTGASVETEVIVQGVLPLMVSRYCAIGSLLGGVNMEKGCAGPCKQSSFALLDRKEILFPVETDNNCYMHIFNSRELCLLETLPYLADTNTAVVRIEARKEDSKYVARTTHLYRRALDMLKEKPHTLPDLSSIMSKLSEGGPGYTRGHYYRGVLD